MKTDDGMTRRAVMAAAAAGGLAALGLFPGRAAQRDTAPQQEPDMTTRAKPKAIRDLLDAEVQYLRTLLLEMLQRDRSGQLEGLTGQDFSLR